MAFGAGHDRGTTSRFSPLHEGDTSVAQADCGSSWLLTVSVPFTRGTPLWPRAWGWICPTCNVSVPFTRGTPLWRGSGNSRGCLVRCFSPLHEGDTSVAQLSPISGITNSPVSVPFTRGTPLWQLARLLRDLAHRRFSPLHEGDTSVALNRIEPRLLLRVSVPFTRGTPLWLRSWNRRGNTNQVSVPFTRGTPLWPRSATGRAGCSAVSVPFTRGTPLWHHDRGRDE